NSSGDQMTGELRFNIDNGSRLKSFFGFNAFVEDAERALPQVVDEAIFGLCLDAASFEVNLATCVGDDGFPLQFGVTPGLGTGIGAPIAAADSPGIYYPISFVDIAENTAYSAFADFTIEITPRFEATIGLRYLKEKREGALASNIPNSYLIETVLLPGVIPGVQALNATLTNPFTNEEIAANFSDFATGNLDAANFEGRTQAELDTLNQTLSGLTPFETTAILQGFFETDGEFTVISIEDEDYLPRFNLLYRVSDTFNVYGSIAKGRRSPVVTFSQNDARTPQFLPAETMWNYEAGFKANFMGGTANLEGSVFFQDYENFTVTDISLLVGEDPVLLTGSKNVGVELFALARVFEGFDVGGTFAWIDSEIDDDPANGEFAGKRFRLQPEYSGSLFFDYTRPITSGNEAFITSTYSYRSKVFFEPSNEPIAGFDIFEDDVHLIDLRLGISSEAQGWEVAGFITNLTDEEYLVDGGNVGGGLGIPTFIAGPPRLWGVEIRKKF
ncbi:MAG: TonB-dependent receptor, partial [Pseudomonadota bacterium]